MKENRARYLTLEAFRREFFAVGSRPRRADVKTWVDDGRLRAIEIDGRVYVREDDAQAFLDGSRVVDHVAERVKNATRERAERIKAARATLARFGL